MLNKKGMFNTTFREYEFWEQDLASTSKPHFIEGWLVDQLGSKRDAFLVVWVCGKHALWLNVELVALNRMLNWLRVRIRRVIKDYCFVDFYVLWELWIIIFVFARWMLDKISNANR